MKWKLLTDCRKKKKAITEQGIEIEQKKSFRLSLQVQHNVGTMCGSFQAQVIHSFTQIDTHAHLIPPEQRAIFLPSLHFLWIGCCTALHSFLNVNGLATSPYDIFITLLSLQLTLASQTSTDQWVCPSHQEPDCVSSWHCWDTQDCAWVGAGLIGVFTLAPHQHRSQNVTVISDCKTTEYSGIILSSEMLWNLKWNQLL